MVRGTEKFAAVEAKRESLVRRPVKVPILEPLTVETIEHCKIPSENGNVQPLVLLAQIIQECEKLYGIRSVVGIAAAKQRDIAIELPTGDEDIILGSSGSLIKCAVVIPAIDE